MLWAVLGLLIGFAAGYYVGRRDALEELGDKALAELKRRDALEYRRTMQRYTRAYRDK